MSLCEAACGGGTETIVREAMSEGFEWRRVVTIHTGAANPRAAQPAEAVAVGRRTVCVFADAREATLDIRCTADGGRSFREAKTPMMPTSEYPSSHIQGVSFLGPTLGWLVVVDTIVGHGQPPRYQTEVWRTSDGALRWRVAHAGPIRPAATLR